MKGLMFIQFAILNP